MPDQRGEIRAHHHAVAVDRDALALVAIDDLVEGRDHSGAPAFEATERREHRELVAEELLHDGIVHRHLFGGHVAGAVVVGLFQSVV